MSFLLLATIVLPLAGALMAQGSRTWARQSALVSTGLTFLSAAILVGRFPGGERPFAVGAYFDWLGAADLSIDARCRLGLDGFSVWLVGLTALLMVVAVLVSWESVGKRAAAYYGLLLLLEAGVLGLFAAQDVILFYVCYELTLVPLLLLIGVWGGRRRLPAATRFFLVHFAGSMMTLLGLLAVVSWVYCRTGTVTSSIPALTAHLADHPIDPVTQVWIFLALLVGLAVRMPLFPLHGWLPAALGEAPTAVGVLLAGVVLKIGGYGFLRFCLPMLPDASVVCMPWLLWASVAAIVYGGLLALAQGELKRLIAYSCVSQLGFCTLGIFSLTPLGMQGGVLQLVHHGLWTGGLLALTGMLHDRFRTHQIAELSAGVRRMPVLACFLAAFVLAGIGVPGTTGFASTRHVLLGLYQSAWGGASDSVAVHYRGAFVGAAAGVVLGAAYLLALAARLFFGGRAQPTSKQSDAPIRDLGFREIAALAPLLVLTVWIGLRPGLFLDRTDDTASFAAGDTVQRTIHAVETSAGQAPATASHRPTGE